MGFLFIDIQFVSWGLKMRREFAKSFSLFVVAFFSSCASVERPLVIAHRGASAYLPEHSLPAVAAAHVMDVDFIEQDVVLTKDQVPIVLHDIHLESTTNVREVFPGRQRKDGHFYAIDFTWKEIQRLSLQERLNSKGEMVFPNRFPQRKTPFGVPSLQQEIDLILGMNTSRKKDIGIYMEIKRPQFHWQEGHRIEEIIISLLKANGLNEKSANVILQSFDPESVKRIKGLSPLKVIQLVGLNSWGEAPVDFEKMMTPEGLLEVAKYADGIGPYMGYFLDREGRVRNKDLVKGARKLGLEVHVYTFRADQLPAGMKDFTSLITIFQKELGVTGLFTDHPDLVQKAVEE